MRRHGKLCRYQRCTVERSPRHQGHADECLGWLAAVCEELELQLRWIYQADLRAETDGCKPEMDHILRESRRHPRWGLSGRVQVWPGAGGRQVGDIYSSAVRSRRAGNSDLQVLHTGSDRIVERLVVRGQRRVRTVTGHSEPKSLEPQRACHSFCQGLTMRVQRDERQAFFLAGFFWQAFSRRAFL